MSLDLGCAHLKLSSLLVLEILGFPAYMALLGGPLP